MLSLFFCGALYIAFKIKLEENITSIIPTDRQVKEVNEVFEGLAINNRLVFHLYTYDSGTAHPDVLVSAADGFADALGANYQAYLDETIAEIPDGQIQIMYDYFYKNLPFYLKEEDYEDIENRILEEKVGQAVEGLYKQLLSPVGILTKMRVKDPLGLAAYPLQRMREQQLDSDFDLYQNHIMSKDRQHLIFFAVLANPPNETSNNGRLIKGIKKQIEAFKETYPKVKLEYFGPAAVAVANANRIKKDIYLTVSLALGALFIFISFFYRSGYTFFVVVTPGIFGGVAAMACLSLLRESVSVISLGVGSVLLGITIDYALHFFTHSKKESNIQRLFKDLTTPLLMSSVTTASAFYSLIFIRSSALQDLGIFAGTSVLVAVLYTLIVLPHIVSKFHVTNDNNLKKNWIEKLVSKIAAYPLHKKRWAIVMLAALTILSLIKWHQVTFESNMLELNYMPKGLQASQKNINAISNFSENNIYVAFKGENLNQALQATQRLSAQLQELKTENAIYDYYLLNDIIPSPTQQQERLKEWNAFWQAHAKDSLIDVLNKAAQSTGFNQNIFRQFQNLLKQDYTSISAEDKSKILSIMGSELVIKNTNGSVSVITSITLPLENKPEVLSQLAETPGIIILDRSYLTANLITLLQEDFSKLINISLLIVFIVILLCYGRIELTLMVFIPILLSWLWVLGLMGWLGLTFNIVNIIICTFIFGLGIDYSIFVMRGLSQQYAYGVDNLLSYKKSIILSIVTTLLGIGVLAFAQHPALRSIASLAIIGILSVVFITFTVEHQLYNFFILNRKKKGVVPFTFTSFILTIVAFSIFLFGCLILFLARLIFFIPIGPAASRKLMMHNLIRFFSSIIIFIMVNTKKEIVDRHNIDYKKPAVIISNHHSFIDTLLHLMLHPKVVMVTNDWVYHSPLFGNAVRYSDFISASKGLENQYNKMEVLIKEGYSIIVFPEGTRNATAQLRRFHKGAFYLAEHFKLDIQPILLHGTHLAMQKGDDFYLKNSKMTVKFLPRIHYDDKSFGESYRDRAKSITKYVKNEYDQLRKKEENPTFYKELLIKNFIYKSPVLEWYIRLKFKFEQKYSTFHKLVPLTGKIVDVGCGYGLVAYALGLSSGGRKILGIDYDEDKIVVAQNCPVRPANLNFISGDALEVPYSQTDVFLVSDVLHYLTTAEQKILLERMCLNLNPSGRIIIRDGDANNKQRHKGTRFTEVVSTGIGFNKTRNKLSYISSDMIASFAENHNLKLEIIDNTRRTSNMFFVLTQN